MAEKDFYQLVKALKLHKTISIEKALSPTEMPLKAKHARTVIIDTFHNQGGHSFWAAATRQPLQDNRITAWKFCHLLHKVLREGHNLCSQHSMRHRNMLTEIGKLWGHLQDGYGNCIQQYTKLLVTRIEFLERNPRLPENLTLKRDELDQIGGDNIDFYFNFSAEIFDYLEDILEFQDTVFKSLAKFNVSSMTVAGQCRLSPLIPCIQDASPLYDSLVQILFKLHAQLPSEPLFGHRKRFQLIFSQLTKFYDQSRSLQYFASLITVPKLPGLAPKFDFGESLA